MAIGDDCCIPDGDRCGPLQSLTGGAFCSQSGALQLQKLNNLYRQVVSVHQWVTEDLYDLRNGSLRLRAQPVDHQREPAMSNIRPLLGPQMPRLRRYARTLTKDLLRAEDLVQSCLLRALEKEHLWEPGTDLRAWLFTIMHNQYVNDIRRLVREGSVLSIDDVGESLPAIPTIEASLELGDAAQAIAGLPRDQREVIILAGREGERYEEMARSLGVPIGTVRSRLSRGRSRLRELMGAGVADASYARRRGRVPLRRAA
jgi:RNA polymerase sigma-70 factor, ECF subfamily